MLRDPFGGWDWDGVRQFAVTVGFLALIISFVASTSGNWYDPYLWIAGIASANAPVTIIIFMVGILALWGYEQFSGGVF